jgi:hypothetical protein
MSLRCTDCGREREIFLGEGGASVRCGCGERVETLPPGPVAEARAKMDLLARLADRVSAMILMPEVPAVDVEIQKAAVREKALELFPDREDLWEMIYEARFRRLWEQFRETAPRRP